MLRTDRAADQEGRAHGAEFNKHLEGKLAHADYASSARLGIAGDANLFV